MLSTDEFLQGIAAYGSAWKAGDPQAIVELFTDDARYYETPFDEPMLGKEAIRRY